MIIYMLKIRPIFGARIDGYSGFTRSRALAVELGLAVHSAAEDVTL
ncbi:MAG: hypothetical protein JXA33_11025 [Anaerolineae bacterium]|nr:hypothetical protein [Anaerolineae bacterium]